MSNPFDPPVSAVLADLHDLAAGDRGRWAARRTDEDGIVRMGEMFLAVSPDEGRLLHMLARASGAKAIVEFGASFGLSTLYLAAAARANGGHVTTTEVHPDKCAALRDTFDRAGVSDLVTLLEGDARETLATVPGPVDLLFLDGWKSLYLPIFQLMRPRLAPGALVLADNIDIAGCADYVAAISDDPGFLTSRTGDMACSYRLPDCSSPEH